MPRKGLEDVLHHFIPEDEQREALSRARARSEPASRSGEPAPREPPDREPRAADEAHVRWCLPTRPQRPLALALAADLAAALTPGGETAILASFEAGPLVALDARVSWTVLVPTAEGVARALDDLPLDADALVLLRPGELAEALFRIEPAQLDGLLIPIDATRWGPSQALGWLRGLRAPPGLRVATVVVGAADVGEAEELSQRVALAARRQLGLELESLGEVARDGSSFRSLLRAVPLFELDADSRSARGIRELSRRLAPGGKSDAGSHT